MIHVFVIETEPMTVAPSHTTVKNFHPRYRPLSQPLSTLYRGPPESNLFYAPCSVFYLFFFVKGMSYIFCFVFSLCQVQKVKSALQHVVLARGAMTQYRKSKVR